MVDITLPPSLSPHICVIASDDVKELFVRQKLPSLDHLLQTFSPLKQVTTRTISLTPIVHDEFCFRVSDLESIERGADEDVEGRAARFIDWLSTRATKNASAALKAGKNHEECFESIWEDICQCLEQDRVPHPTEGWNDPLAVVFAVSTLAPNPLQALDQLNAHGFKLPSWTDTNILRYNLVIDTPDSTLTMEETDALFNAIRKQYGPLAYHLKLDMEPNPNPTSMNLAFPFLPSSANLPHNVDPVQPIALPFSMHDSDETLKFLRSLLVMSLIPWMEKLLIDWNEMYNSTRRLPSRLFSSTRKLFGNTVSVPISPPPKPHNNISSKSNPKSPTLANHNARSPVRRSAEFATILGDFKTALNIWESLRKETFGGADVIPLLSSFTPSHSSYIYALLQSTNAQETPAYELLLCLRYVSRWEYLVTSSNTPSVELARWMALAACSSEEAPAALALGRAASLGAVDPSLSRIATLWFVLAADRLERCGIKPLAIYFLDRANVLIRNPRSKNLSPSFGEAEFLWSSRSPSLTAISTHINHSLGRLYYATGDMQKALERLSDLFITKNSLEATHTVNGQSYPFVEDFRSAFEHVLANRPEKTELNLEVKFCLPNRTRIVVGDFQSEHNDDSHALGDIWERYRLKHGFEPIQPNQVAEVGDTVWIHISLYNPLDAEIELSGVSLHLSPSVEPLEVEYSSSLCLGPNVERTIAFKFTADQHGHFEVTHLSYRFLSLLPHCETLVIQGRRLNDTLQQMRSVEYAKSYYKSVDVIPRRLRLQTGFIEPDISPLISGECRAFRLSFLNTGLQEITGMWMIWPSTDVIHMFRSEENTPGFAAQSIAFRIQNTITDHEPGQILPLDGVAHLLEPEKELFIDFTHQAPSASGVYELRLWIVYSSAQGMIQKTAITQRLVVEQELHLQLVATPSEDVELSYLVCAKIENTSPDLRLDLVQLSILSPLWEVREDPAKPRYTLYSNQWCNIFMNCFPRPATFDGWDTMHFVKHAARALLGDLQAQALSHPPSISIQHSILFQHEASITPDVASIAQAKWKMSKSQELERKISLSPPYPSFPIIHPLSLDVAIFWRQASSTKRGFLLATGLFLGAGFPALENILVKSEEQESRRALYTTTKREIRFLSESLRQSAWNLCVNPIYLVSRVEPVIHHDLKAGPCHVTVCVSLKNYSPYYPAKFYLKLADLRSREQGSISLSKFQPRPVGSLNREGILKPLETSDLNFKLWVIFAGTYEFGEWILTVESGQIHAGNWSCVQKFPDVNPSARVSFTVVQAM